MESNNSSNWKMAWSSRASFGRSPKSGSNSSAICRYGTLSLAPVGFSILVKCNYSKNQGYRDVQKGSSDSVQLGAFLT